MNEQITKMASLIGEEHQRYGRQLILPEIGMKGQMKLKSSSALIIGVGGLGCPAATYLAGAGVGTIGLVDGDVVEISNLHRQTLHTTKTVNVSKVQSAIMSLQALNPLVQYIPYTSHVATETILRIVEKYDIVLDCTDHPTSRYLISDACVIAQKPLVSASALRVDGQLMVLNYPALPAGNAKGGLCYRCVFPKPPPPESIISCGEGGILGPVVGTMGVLQALEIIKILTGQDNDACETRQSWLLMFSAFRSPPFRSIKLRGRKDGCQACSKAATVDRDSLEQGTVNYAQFCGVASPVDLLTVNDRISPHAYANLSKEQKETSLVVDVREEPQFDICKLDQSVNVPWSTMATWKQKEDIPQEMRRDNDGKGAKNQHLYFICRYGNDSQLAVQKMKELLQEHEVSQKFQDISGGFRAWRDQIDPNFPDY